MENTTNVSMNTVNARTAEEKKLDREYEITQMWACKELMESKRELIAAETAHLERIEERYHQLKMKILGGDL